jgi:hypothetical protein
MGHIYSQARQVFIWLGGDHLVGEGANMAYNFIRRYATCDDYTRTLDAPESQKQRFALREALEIYWSRAWVTQEVALARNIKLLAHHTEIDLSQIRDTTLVNHLRINFPSSGQPRNVTQYDFWDLATNFERTASEGRVKMCPRDTKAWVPQSLYHLLADLNWKECLVARDRVFSLVSMCKERPRFQVDYPLGDLALVHHICRASKRKLCFCYAVDLLRALELLGNMDGENGVDSPYRDQLFLETDVRCTKAQRKHCACQYQVGHRPGEQYHSLCLREVCEDTRGHLTWNASEVVFSVSNERTQNVTSLVVVSRSADNGHYTLRLSLPFLEMLSRWQWKIYQSCRNPQYPPNHEVRFVTK